ncbi:43kDa postsynaptic protein [Parasponia andersonii]|uniref:RING-type E3 ubiquitin transferase n=1 Tax=Parasponia andersonii TaxID=3476 RepID=A0A2P5AXD5_PARAD|nr:43kDa postsynaptic protein [Parasponia andersonii]
MLGFETTVSLFLEGLLITSYNDQDEIDCTLRELAEAILTVPASQSSIEALKEVKVESLLGDHRDHDQTIFLEELSFDHDDQDDCVQTLVEMMCSHVYHKDCIQQWLKTSYMCPLCHDAMPTSY